MPITPLPAQGSPSWYAWASDIDAAARAGGGGSTLAVASTVTASGALVVAKHNPVDATSGTKAMTLPTGAASGTLLSVEKTDASVNTVTVTGNVRGAAGTTISLAWQNEALLFAADTAGSWWVVAGHRTKTSLDAVYLTTAGAPELIRDTIGTALVAGTNVTITVNDPADTITIAAAGGGGTAAAVSYDPSASPSLAATNVQTALDEIVADYLAADTATITSARSGMVLATDIPIVVGRGHGIAGADENMLRTAISGNSNITAGVLTVSYFTAGSSRSVTTIEVATAGTAASPAPTLARMGLYSVDGSGNLTLMAGTTSDTTLFTAASTVYAKTFTSQSLVKGNRYAVGVIQVGSTTPPKLYGAVLVGAITSRAPALSHQVTGQTDLPASVAVGSLAATPGASWVAVY